MGYKDKTKQAEYQRTWLSKRRSAWLEGKSCITCGSTTSLEIDHINRAQKVSHKVWSWTPTRREDELNKCQILCSDCHRAKTKRDMNYGLKHGTNNGYIRYGCRCNLCTNAAVQKSNEYRWRTGRRKKRQTSGL